MNSRNCPCVNTQMPLTALSNIPSNEAGHAPRLAGHQSVTPVTAVSRRNAQHGTDGGRSQSPLRLPLHRPEPAPLYRIEPVLYTGKPLVDPHTSAWNPYSRVHITVALACPYNHPVSNLVPSLYTVVNSSALGLNTADSISQQPESIQCYTVLLISRRFRPARSLLNRPSRGPPPPPPPRPPTRLRRESIPADDSGL